VSVAPTSSRLARRRYRRRRVLTEAGSVMLGVVLLIWSLTPVYNMLLIALDTEEGEVEFSGNIWPPEPSLDSFRVVLMQDDWYLEHFWQQFGNSLYIGLLTMFLTVLIGSLASFAVGRMRLAKGSLLTNAALLTYAIPASFLIVPFYRIMHSYGLSNNFWAVIAAQVTFATPFAILVLREYARLMPIELDDAARVDGASAVQLYLRVYLPLMTPALAVVAIYALLLAWNDYLYQFVLLSSTRNMTVSVTQSQLFGDADAPWNAMMAAAILYALPPMAIFFALRRYIVAGLTTGGGKGLGPERYPTFARHHRSRKP
jgi:multiple sugar transport system permease protein